MNKVPCNDRLGFELDYAALKLLAEIFEHEKQKDYHNKEYRKHCKESKRKLLKFKDCFPENFDKFMEEQKDIIDNMF